MPIEFTYSSLALNLYGIEDAEGPNYDGVTGDSLAGYIPNAKFEWYLKNHLGSTMLVYGTQADANPQHVFVGTPLDAYDYRAFGEMVEMLPPAQKVTENFTGKEHDDEIALDYFGARYLDPMLGMWISVDPKRQFASPYLYAGNGYNPVNVVDPDGNRDEFVTQLVNGVNQNAVQNFFSGILSSSNLKAQQTFDKVNKTVIPYMEKGRTIAQIAAVVGLCYKIGCSYSKCVERTS